MPHQATRRHPRQLHLRAAGDRAASRRAEGPDHADRQCAGEASGARGGGVHAVQLPLDELPADARGERRVHDPHVGHVYGGGARVQRVPPVRVRGVFGQVERAACEDGFSGVPSPFSALPLPSFPLLFEFEAKAEADDGLELTHPHAVGNHDVPAIAPHAGVDGEGYRAAAQ